MTMRKRESETGSTKRAEAVAKLLQSLGDTEEEVARSLDWAGVRGLQRDMANCPVASFLRIVGGYDNCVESLTVTSTTVKINIKPWWRQKLSVPLPTAVRAFVSAFDKGRFQNLVLRMDATRDEGAGGDAASQGVVPVNQEAAQPLVVMP
jgi:hypothetical protein